MRRSFCGSPSTRGQPDRRPDLWLIVDDGSRDATPDMVARYAAEYPWIRLLRRDARAAANWGPGWWRPLTPAWPAPGG